MTTITVNPGESIQDAINSLPPEGGVVELATGAHAPDATEGGTIELVGGVHTIYAVATIKDRQNITIRGMGETREETEIKYPDYPDFDIFYILNCANITIENMDIHSTGTGYIPRNTGHAIVASMSNPIKVSNVKVERLGSGVMAGPITAWTPPPEDFSHNIKIEDCLFSYCRSGIWLWATYDSIVKRCEINHMQSQGFYVNAHNYNSIIEECIFGDNQGFGISVYSSCYNTMIKNNIFYGTTNRGGVWVYSCNFDTTIRDNTIRDNKNGIYVTLRSTGPGNLRIYNNKIYSSNYDGIMFYEDDFNGSGVGAEIESNTIYSNGRDGIRLEGLPDGYIITAKNNIITNNRGYGVNRLQGNIISSYNDVFNNIYGNYNGCLVGAGDISADPLFVSPPEDFHLKSIGGHWTPDGWILDAETSPCICAGDPSSDYNNEPAPNGGRINMGAYGNTMQASKSWFEECSKPTSLFTHNAKLCT